MATTRKRKRCHHQDDSNDDNADNNQPPIRQRRRVFNGTLATQVDTRMQAVGRFVRASVGFLFRGRSMGEGTYFDTISGLWETQAVQAFADMKTVNRLLKRTDPRKHKNLANCRHFDNERKVRSSVDPYDKTYEGVRNRSLAPKSTPSRTSHSSEAMKDAIWPTNILGPAHVGEIAHMLPASPADADSWWFVIPWLFGWKKEQWTWRQLQKGIHGCAAGSGNREQHTGTKHVVSNKARILGQGRFLDGDPCILVIPILSPEKTRDWNGEGYDAIVLIDKWEASTLTDVAISTGFHQPCEAFADRGEIDMARELLAVYLRAILTAVRHVPNSVSGEYEGCGSFYSGDGIVVPARTSPTFPIVRKVRFVDQSWDGAADKHPAPDPILLASRAAVIFSARHNQRLAASTAPQEEDEEHWTELDQLAAEEYLDWREAGLRSRMDADLQPFVDAPTEMTSMR